MRKWGSKVNLVQALAIYNNLRKANNEPVQYFSNIFNKVYNSIPAHIKTPPWATQLQYAEAFDYEFSILLREREREYVTLADMKNDSVKF